MNPCGNNWACPGFDRLRYTRRQLLRVGGLGLLGLTLPKFLAAEEKPKAKPSAAAAEVVATPAPAPAPVRRSRKAKPIQDEWGFFDPEQCGFAALLAKLDEITEGAEEPEVQKR